jgi:twitching motility protein PilT
MARVDSFLELVVKQGASDLHLMSGETPWIRLHGELHPVKYRELTISEAEQLLFEVMPEDSRQAFKSRCGLDLAYQAPGLCRFRVNVFRHLGGIGAVFRVIPSTIPTLQELNMPPVLQSLCHEKKGLILVVGPTGSGKSTTLAAMIDCINANRKAHIMTIEDPVEFLHQRRQCLISQKEVGFHTKSFSSALRAALREDPNVILVGELRDLETVSMAVSAAETGILILATLHTNGASATVDRIVNLFPGSEQGRIRNMLSTSLRGIVSQQLLRRADGKGRVAATEILVNTAATANMIREGKSKSLVTAMQSGALVGMQSMDQALQKLLDARLVSGNEAYARASNRQGFERYRDREELA